MVNMRGMEANFVLNPNTIKIAQTNSAKMAAMREISGPKPIGSANLNSPVEISLESFGHPWDSINPPKLNLKSNLATEEFVSILSVLIPNIVETNDFFP